MWLERAAKQNDHDGTMYLSALLAASPDEALRDPKRSLQLLEKIFSHLGNNPSAQNTRLASYQSKQPWYGDLLEF